MFIKLTKLKVSDCVIFIQTAQNVNTCTETFAVAPLITACFSQFWSHALYYTGHVTKTAIFENSRWRTAAIMKIALSQS